MGINHIITNIKHRYYLVSYDTETQDADYQSEHEITYTCEDSKGFLVELDHTVNREESHTLKATWNCIQCRTELSINLQFTEVE